MLGVPTSDVHGPEGNSGEGVYLSCVVRHRHLWVEELTTVDDGFFHIVVGGDHRHGRRLGDVDRDISAVIGGKDALHVTFLRSASMSGMLSVHVSVTSPGVGGEIVAERARPSCLDEKVWNSWDGVGGEYDIVDGGHKIVCADGVLDSCRGKVIVVVLLADVCDSMGG